MEKLTTAYVRESFSGVTYEDTLDPLTLKELKERLLDVYVNDFRVRILEVLRKDIELPVTYHAHITRAIGRISVYKEDTVISSLVRKINKICLGGRCSK